MTFSEADDLATQSIQAAQKNYKRQYDQLHKCTPSVTSGWGLGSHTISLGRVRQNEELSFLTLAMVCTVLYKSQALEWWHKECKILKVTKSASISIGLLSAHLTFLLGIIGMEVASMVLDGLLSGQSD